MALNKIILWSTRRLAGVDILICKKGNEEMAKYIIRKNTQSEYYWVLQSSENFKTVAMSSESYDSKQGAKKSIAWTQANGNTVTISDETGE